MKLLRNIALGISALLILGLGLIYATGNGALLSAGWAVAFGGPSLPFDATDTAAPPDYADTANWAALPDRVGVEDSIPAGISDADVQATAPVDVFFIHPTGYLAGDSWTFSMDPNTKAEENTHGMANLQALTTVAVRYMRRAIARPTSLLTSVVTTFASKLWFAYQDVRRAFQYFLQHHSQGRAFVIASHTGYTSRYTLT